MTLLNPPATQYQCSTVGDRDSRRIILLPSFKCFGFATYQDLQHAQTQEEIEFAVLYGALIPIPLICEVLRHSGKRPSEYYTGLHVHASMRDILAVYTVQVYSLTVSIVYGEIV